jgi:serine-type D-Ala-D-Ala carboxypeptidase
VADYLPEFGRQGKERVTVRQLLTHTSGLDEGSAQATIEELYNRRAPRSAFFDLACDLGLERPPGERWIYRQLPFVVLAELITRLGGRDYPDWLRHELFAPLGMVDTGFIPADTARLVTHPGTDQSDNTWDYAYSLAIPAYGLYSTAADLIAFGQALLSGGRRGTVRILGAGAVEAMATPQPGLVADEGIGTRPVFAGLAWGTRSPFGNIIGSARGFGHSGGTGCWLWIDPDRDLVFALLSNSAGPPQSWAMRLLNAVYGAWDRKDDA